MRHAIAIVLVLILPSAAAAAPVNYSFHGLNRQDQARVETNLSRLLVALQCRSPDPSTVDGLTIFLSDESSSFEFVAAGVYAENGGTLRGGPADVFESDSLVIFWDAMPDFSDLQDHLEHGLIQYLRTARYHPKEVRLDSLQRSAEDYTRHMHVIDGLRIDRMTGAAYMPETKSVLTCEIIYPTEAEKIFEDTQIYSFTRARDLDAIIKTEREGGVERNANQL